MRIPQKKYKPGNKKVRLSQEIKHIYKSLIIVVISLNAILASLLLYFGSHQNTLGYKLKELQLNNMKLIHENRIIDTQIIEVKTTKTLENSEKTKSMESLLNPEVAKEKKVTWFEQGSRLVTK